ncbi:MAG TPA: hypothetical protein VFW34_03670 [Candidatus Rubrimentiphilum sp.]|nr:hypothetical protein [Candidatus Rubrimentiphilum sp.]
MIALALSLALAAPSRACGLPKIEAGLQRTYDDPDGAKDTKAVHDTLLRCYRDERNAEVKAHEGYLIVRFDAFAIDYFMRKNLDESVFAQAREMTPVYRALPTNSPWFARAKPLWERAQHQIAIVRASRAAGIHS